MEERSQSHATWDCTYHVVFSSKYRTKRLYGDVRRELGDLSACSSKGMPDRGRASYARPVYPCAYADIDPADILGVAHCGLPEGQNGPLRGQQIRPQAALQRLSLLGRVGTSSQRLDEQVARRYIRNQEKADKASDFADLFNRSH